MEHLQSEEPFSSDPYFSDLQNIFISQQVRTFYYRISKSKYVPWLIFPEVAQANCMYFQIENYPTKPTQMMCSEALFRQYACSCYFSAKFGLVQPLLKVSKRNKGHSKKDQRPLMPYIPYLCLNPQFICEDSQPIVPVVYFVDPV